MDWLTKFGWMESCEQGKLKEFTAGFNNIQPCDKPNESVALGVALHMHARWLNNQALQNIRVRKQHNQVWLPRDDAISMYMSMRTLRSKKRPSSAREVMVSSNRRQSCISRVVQSEVFQRSLQGSGEKIPSMLLKQPYEGSAFTMFVIFRWTASRSAKGKRTRWSTMKSPKLCCGQPWS